MNHPTPTEDHSLYLKGGNRVPEVDVTLSQDAVIHAHQNGWLRVEGIGTTGESSGPHLHWPSAELVLKGDWRTNYLRTGKPVEGS